MTGAVVDRALPAATVDASAGALRAGAVEASPRTNAIAHGDLATPLSRDGIQAADEGLGVVTQAVGVEGAGGGGSVGELAESAGMTSEEEYALL